MAELTEHATGDPRAESAAPALRSPGKLRRELGFIGTLALAIGIMAPTGALSINGVPAAGLVGQSVPFAFLVASIAILPVAYGFIRLSQHISHSGSVYAFCGITIGPRAGFVGGVSLAAVYTAFTAGAAALVGLFGAAFLANVGVTVDWYWLAFIAGVVVAVLAYLDIRQVTRILLTAEGISICITAVLFVIIYARIASGSAPQHQTLSLTPFSVPGGAAFSVIGLALIGGFLSFAGFEGTATMGEESLSARRTIPKVLLVLVIALAVYFVFGMYTEVVGFGTTTRGITAFAGSSSALADLANLYVGTGLASVIDIGAMLSVFAASLGTAVAASRIIFSLARDGFGPPVLARTSTRFGAPYGAISAVMILTFITILIFAVSGNSGVNAFFYPGTFGTLVLLALYIMTEVGAILYLFVRRSVQVPMWEAVIPVVGIIILIYVLYRNVWPIPGAPYNVIVILSAVWLVLSIVPVLVAPRLARSIGTRLIAEVAGD